MSNTFNQVLDYINSTKRIKVYKTNRDVMSQKPQQTSFKKSQLFFSIVDNIQYHKLLDRAKQVLPTTQVYDSFKEVAKTSFEDGNLNVIERTLQTFETLKANESSPTYSQQLDNLTLDPFFSNFTDILTQISPINDTSVPTFSSTDNFNEHLLNELSPEQQYQNTLIDTKEDEELEKPEKPDFTNKTIRYDYPTEENVIAPFSEDFNPSSIISQKTINSVTQTYETVVNDPNSTQENLNELDESIKVMEENKEVDVEAPLEDIFNEQTDNLKNINSNDDDLQNTNQEAIETQQEINEEIKRQIIQAQEQVA